MRTFYDVAAFCYLAATLMADRAIDAARSAFGADSCIVFDREVER